MNFIVGCGRSGTTATVKDLSLNSDLNIQNETFPYLSRETFMVNNNIQLDKKLAVKFLFLSLHLFRIFFDNLVLTCFFFVAYVNYLVADLFGRFTISACR